MELKRSFRAVAEAIDGMPEAETTDFLARLVLILASDLNDAEKFERAVQRAKAAIKQQETAE